MSTEEEKEDKTIKRFDIQLKLHEFADVMIKLKFEGMFRSQLMKVLVLGYLREDPLIRQYINKIKEQQLVNVTKKNGRKQAAKFRKVQKFLDKAETFSNQEVNDIFDVIEDGDIDIDGDDGNQLRKERLDASM